MATKDRPLAPNATLFSSRPLVAYLFGALVVLFLAVLLCAGYLSRERALALETWQDRLSATADDRKSAIENWLREHLNDADAISSCQEIGLFLAGQPPNSPRASGSPSPNLEGLLDGAAQSLGYRGIYLLDGERRVVLATRTSPPLPDGCGAWVKAMGGGQEESVDFFTSSGGRPILAFWHRVSAAASAGPKGNAGSLVLLADPEEWLYPFLNHQPIPTASLETYLLRRQGPDLLYLSPLRFARVPPLTVHIPYRNSAVAGAGRLAATGFELQGEFTDYRGVVSRAVTRTIKGTSWGLVVKVSKAEALDGYREKAQWISLGLIGLLLATAGAGANLWRRQQVEYFQAINHRDKRLRLLRDSANDMVFFATSEGRILETNRSAEEILGYSSGEFLALTLRDLNASSAEGRPHEEISQSPRQGGKPFEGLFARRDGTTLPVEFNEQVVETDQGPLRMAVVRDISQRKVAEARILKLNRMIRTVSHINQMIVRERDPDTLAASACRILVESGGFGMAWIGLLDDSRRHLLTKAAHGIGLELPAERPLSVGAEGGAVSPAASVVNSGRPYVCLDVHAEPGWEAWREIALLRGLVSAGLFPLTWGGQAKGILGVHAGQRDGIGEEEKGLLGEMADDVAFALGSLDEQAAHAAAEMALRESEVRYRSLFERNLAGVYRSRLDGGVIDCNDAFARIFGYDSVEDVLSQSPSAFYADDDGARRFRERLMREKAMVNVETRGRRRDGSAIWLLENAALVRDEQGRETIIEGTCWDLTERRKAEEDRLLLSAAIEQSQETILITDREGKILYVNSAFEKTTGFSRLEAIGQSPRIMRSGTHDRTFYEELWSTILAGNLWSGRITNRRKDMTLFTAQVAISPVRDPSGAIVAFVAAQRDISEELDLQRRLEQSKNLQTIGLIAGGVAHEVRNPLFAIQTIVAALERKLADQPQFGEYVAHIKDQSARLNDLMNDLLLLGKPVEAMSFALCALDELLEEAHRQLDAGSSAPHQWVIDSSVEPLLVRGIADKLVQVFLNLTSNASAFSPKGQPIRLRLWREDDTACVAVSDLGPGIPKPMLPRLFEPFASKRKGGTGLGLAIVQKIVEAHGGSIEAANNDPPPGATFTVRLPAAMP